jgi:hypothetical protein
LPGEKAPAARKKTSTGLLHVIKISATAFLPKKNGLRHVRRPQQGYCYYMSQKTQEGHFRRKKSVCGTQESATGLLHVSKNPGTSFLPKKKRLRHVRRLQQGYYMSQKSQERHFCRKKGACGT